MTTFRQLSEEVVNKVGSFLGKNKSPWTREVHLPGANFLLTCILFLGAVQLIIKFISDNNKFI